MAKKTKMEAMYLPYDTECKLQEATNAALEAVPTVMKD
jgi:hypothetical protein